MKRISTAFGRFPLAILLLLTALCWPPLLPHATAQQPKKPTAAELHQSIKKLNVLGSVLYVAAHPDDENTRMISYLRNEKLYDVTYLSLTRGDGGQNLIGPEIRELLGVLRTQELLMARSVDGGRQRFSRANDFGFSKSPDETLRIWDKDAVLSDVVWTMRLTQPDVVINRFYHDKKYDTHGHHTASAMLSVEAFKMAGDAAAYPDQLRYTQPWQPRRQFFNTSWWFFGSQEAFDKMDKSSLFSVDIGGWLPLLGKSNNEIAAESRSMHRCQGFGMLSTRGSSLDWLDFVQGDRPAENDLFQGINTSWTRVEGGAPIGELLTQIDRNFRPDNPAASVPDLLRAMDMIKNLPDGHWKQVKLAEIKEVIRGCLGIYLEATAATPVVTPGETVKIRLECIARANYPVVLSAVQIRPLLFDTVLAKNLEPNKGLVFETPVRIPADAGITAPYWLQQTFDIGMYHVDDQQLRGLPETPRFAKVRWSITVDGRPLEYETEVAYKIDEPAVGEVWRPFEVLPPVTAAFDQPSYIFPNSHPRHVGVEVRAGRDSVAGSLTLQAPEGWTVKPSAAEFKLGKRGETQILHFTVQPAGKERSGQFKALAKLDGRDWHQRLVTIKYDHIPQQSVLLDNATKAVSLDLQVTAKNIGYYMGAGDDIPNALRQMGCTVTLLEDKDMEADNLRRFDAVVIGIRAYNTKENLKFHQPKLYEYVRNGGTLILQYNNNFDLVLDQLAPVPLKLARTRTTDENAEVRLLQAGHRALTAPNRIGAADFEGWVQERGLYFPSEWDPSLQALLSMNDPGEKPADGALLVGKFGKGYYVYTGLSFFRELPAGVPGAYRLFANLLSLGKS